MLSPSVLVVHYEDLKSSPGSQLRRIHAYFSLPVTERRLRCVEWLAFERTRRAGDFKPSGDDLGREVVEKAAEAIDKLDRVLEKTGHGRIPRHLYGEIYS